LSAAHTIMGYLLPSREGPHARTHTHNKETRGWGGVSRTLRRRVAKSKAPSSPV
jgi:hypothetical protein